MSMIVTSTILQDVLLFEPKLISDDRGWFFESFNEKDFFKLTGKRVIFVQDNHSLSLYGVLRGLHYQMRNPQAKLIRVCRGSIFDVAIDLRQSSPTFGKWEGVKISAENMRQRWIPEGFAHGFMVLSEVAEVLYKTTDYWHSQSEHSIVWNDDVLNIGWPILGQEPILSFKDLNGLSWGQAPKFN